MDQQLFGPGSFRCSCRPEGSHPGSRPTRQSPRHGASHEGITANWARPSTVRGMIFGTPRLPSDGTTGAPAGRRGVRPGLRVRVQEARPRPSIPGAAPPWPRPPAGRLPHHSPPNPRRAARSATPADFPRDTAALGVRITYGTALRPPPRRTPDPPSASDRGPWAPGSGAGPELARAPRERRSWACSSLSRPPGTMASLWEIF